MTVTNDFLVVCALIRKPLYGASVFFSVKQVFSGKDFKTCLFLFL